jgi:autotransporter-associated beta strand protein
MALSGVKLRARRSSCRCGRLAAASLAVALPNAVLAQGVSNLFTGLGTVWLPYATENGEPSSLPQLKTTFGNSGLVNYFTMDTGSTGIVVSPDRLDTTNLSSLGPGQITYSSSGKKLWGTYYQTTINFFNGDTIAATATVPVLVVDKQTCTQNPRNCTPKDHLTGVSQMGIGFGQELAGQPTGTPDKNPFLNITATATPSGALPSGGYVVTATGVRLGLTAAEAKDFALVKLAPFRQFFTATRPEWVLAPASVSVNGRTGNGAVLSDTGVTGMYVTPPPGASIKTQPIVGGAECGNNCAAPGTLVQVFMPGKANPIAAYGFTVGVNGGKQASNPLSPSFVSVDESSGTTFVNTTVNFFNGYDYLYDAVNGFVGYRPTGAVDARIASATPSMALQGGFTVADGFQSSLSTILLDRFQVSNTNTTRGFTYETGAGVTLTAQGTGLFSGPLSGPGSLTVAGGTILLSGANSYTGVTTVNAGATLGLRGVGTIASSAGLIANGTFDLSGTAAGASVANLSGTGTLKLGAQTLTLTNAAGSFSGTIADGGLSGGSGGRLFVAAGTQALTGTNTYTGGTTVTGGSTLAVNGDAALGAANGGLTLNNGTLMALGNVATTRAISVGAGGGTVDGNGYTISLNGPLTVDGSWTTSGDVLVGGSANVSGWHTVASGTTAVNGLLSAGAVMIGPGATLRGTGTIDAPTLVAGTLAPGNSPGTLTFTQSVAMQPGSTLSIDVDGPGIGTGAGNFSRVVLSGPNSAFTAGGQLQPVLRGITGSATNSYTPPLGQVLPVIEADGGIAGSFSGLNQPTAGLAAGTRFDTLYGNNALSLVVTPAAYGNLAAAGLAQTANERAVGTALDSARPPAGVRMSGEAAGLFSVLYPLTAQAIGPALDQLAGNTYGDILLNNAGSQRLVMDAVADQLSARRGAATGSGGETAATSWTGTVWVRGLAQWSDLGNAGTQGYSASSGGAAVGADVRLPGGYLAGAALAYTGGGLSSRDGGSADTQALHLLGYGSWNRGPLFADLQLGGSWSDDSVRRDLGSFGTQARGTAHGTGVFTDGRVGAAFDYAGFHVEPSAGLSLQRLNRNSLTEDAPSAVALHVRENGFTSFRSLIGARADRVFVIRDQIVLTPALHLGWGHQFADTTASTDAVLAGIDVPFTTTTSGSGRDSLLAGAAVTAQLSPRLALYASYDADLRVRFTGQALTGGLRYTW